MAVLSDRLGSPTAHTFNDEGQDDVARVSYA
jgi:hypothetical protein